MRRGQSRMIASRTAQTSGNAKIRRSPTLNLAPGNRCEAVYSTTKRAKNKDKNATRQRTRQFSDGSTPRFTADYVVRAERADRQPLLSPTLGQRSDCRNGACFAIRSYIRPSAVEIPSKIFASAESEMPASGLRSTAPQSRIPLAFAVISRSSPRPHSPPLPTPALQLTTCFTHPPRQPPAGAYRP